MKHRQIIVHDIEGNERRAALCTCEDCGSEHFFCYLIDNRFPHLQCTGCGTTYCQHDGVCSAPSRPAESKEPQR